ncbi:hypothetical protein SAMN06296058_3190 [Pseudoxanthomonas indica]|uniref:Uncharacterized protein n=1 Tax=Pseudoxanthomonas indica TaxID=428993 RepID=A0A1T5LVK9_9GAMM|nr:hypothetical protein SAMN06296058_3190 [Pseudoxanthomonas indica]
MLLLALSAPAQERVVQMENVRLDYAQVLNVEPVYQTLRANRTEEVCDELPTLPTTTVHPTKEQSRWARFLDSVKGVFTSDDDEAKASNKPSGSAEPALINCRVVPVEREFRRPIAYDVDYVYKGTKYRSRLAEDPGNRLRIRISVMPYVPGAMPAETTAETP